MRQKGFALFYEELPLIYQLDLEMRAKSADRGEGYLVVIEGDFAVHYSDSPNG